VAVERLVLVVDEGLAGRIAPFHAVQVGADPQVVAAVVVQHVDAHVADAVAGIEPAPRRRGRCRPIAQAPGFEAGGGADPERVARAHRQRGDAVAAGVAGPGVVDVVMVETGGAGDQVVDADAGAHP
jgi:hypothetical protein